MGFNHPQSQINNNPVLTLLPPRLVPKCHFFKRASAPWEKWIITGLKTKVNKLGLDHFVTLERSHKGLLESDGRTKIERHSTGQNEKTQWNETPTHRI